ncbi:hypothetical protein FOCC_FOCC017015, partial [Frankliniella occidentalis]
MIEDSFLELMSRAPQDAAHVKFSDYVLYTYIDSTRFPSTLWSHAPSLAEPTTTNAAENYNG